MARKCKKKAGKMKTIQTLTFHAKETDDEGRLMTLVNRYTSLNLKKHRGHKPKGIILNFLSDKLEKAIATEERKRARRLA